MRGRSFGAALFIVWSKREKRSSDQAGRKLSDRPLMQWRLPVGLGPSSKIWPRWPPQRRQCSSTRDMPSVESMRVAVARGSAA